VKSLILSTIAPALAIPELENRLTSETQGEIIVFVERVAVFPPAPALFPPSFRIHTSVHSYR
jgi:hypothetical protein